MSKIKREEPVDFGVIGENIKHCIDDDDPVTIANWLIKIGEGYFPFENDELDLIHRVSTHEEPLSVHTRYELVILYWQMVGFLRKRGDSRPKGRRRN